MNNNKFDQIESELKNPINEIYKLFNQKDSKFEELKNVIKNDQSINKQLKEDIRVLELKIKSKDDRLKILELQLKSKDDQLKLKDEQLKFKDEEIKKLKDNKPFVKPTLKSRNSSNVSALSALASSPTKNLLQTKSVIEPRTSILSIESDDLTKARKSKSMFENFRLMPTQYSDTEEESSSSYHEENKENNSQRSNSLSSKTSSLSKEKKTSQPSLNRTRIEFSSPTKLNHLKSKSVYEAKPKSNNNHENWKSKSMIENISDLATQYSDSEDESTKNNENINSSPIKIKYDENKPIMKYTKDDNLFISPTKSMKPPTTSSKHKISPIKLQFDDNGKLFVKSYKRQKSVELKEDEDPFYDCPVVAPPLVEPTSPIKSSQSIEEVKIEENIEDANNFEDEIIEDSQEGEMSVYSTPPPTTQYSNELNSPPISLTSSPEIKIPENIITINQKRKYLLDYYTSKFQTDLNFKINLIQNPIKQISWDFIDFIKNLNYKPMEFSQFLQKHQIKDPTKFNKYKTFFNLNENWKIEDKLSQIFDKFESPPGFMKSDFPTSQELIERKKLIDKRQTNRINRRIKSCLFLNDQNQQIGEFIFSCDILNKYVISGRWYIR
ncbi:uncharacterized protein KGF55_003482 [Candida pseudojiufengensis]|uniref:uncharacterized protein n=1 Tax=Candida pseudojiufengensis TaxID=497109 RepID=UPI0022245352|nr:uncharacterized protein KGF55_003482 [Candida pseudojiufengensis]KAI5962406.1 hypothetical protein KGF55_003482 [Candida pseudojiufengensis]